jgi:hypothetical protein
MEYFCLKIHNIMDAVWYGIAAIFEWVFAIAKPIGPYANAFFIAVGFIGTAFWLWYGEKTRKGGDNFLADNADKK